MVASFGISWALRERPAPKLFTLLMPWGRVGSHLVASALEAEPGIHVENEPTTEIMALGHQAGLAPEVIRDQQYLHLAEFASNLPRGLRAAGLKLSHRSLIDQTGYMRHLSELGFRLVLMVRRNHLKSAVSQLRALARSQEEQCDSRWASPWAVTADEPKPGPDTIDVAEAMRLAAEFETTQVEMMETVLAVYGTEWKRVEYERLCVDPDGTIREVFDNLSLKAPKAIAIRYRKATSDCLVDDVVNYEELRSAAVEAGLERFL
ncbi:MAG: hypothetical protein AAF414_07650 [Pseudomonadota bacterium]